jgi:hypothetical protein
MSPQLKAEMYGVLFTKHLEVESIGQSRGLIMLWHDDRLELCASNIATRMMTTAFSRRSDGFSYAITNVYGPCDENARILF